MYASNLALTVKHEDMRNHFSKFGEVISTTVLHYHKREKKLHIQVSFVLIFCRTCLTTIFSLCIFCIWQNNKPLRSCKMPHTRASSGVSCI
ncbi:putative nucleotide-binding alpha-beta plait domain superfamily, RNA-binding domain superfamily [Helianthus annuus]|uniref:Nucleotide-binding alpha-beta plait domain superfamily, RNA-binding domain superfamily n=1 Tax=Helianthus annuus TaxID=4232 RepID=A0A9K3DY10_HELAN|nr:putative nucleotide-binding alpha-beta plait domain superfamily, RNA-binding domain superfamily [Helianthus annuus]KAJ0823503.1 putative nucleotide-binding alpha-beta plait domain superfamily, RNA-binding domain superfamily [Helianthus annuus]